jgi:hypothetical protein
LLDGHGVDSRLAAAIRVVASTHSVERTSLPEASPLALGGAADAYTAVYVHAQRFSIAVDPEVARKARDRHGLAVQEKTDTTWYVQVGAGDLPALASVVAELLEHAFVRSYQGPRWDRGLPQRPQTGVRATCSVHNIVRLPSGACSVDPDCSP